MKALPKEVNELFKKNLLSAILLEKMQNYSFLVGK